MIDVDAYTIRTFLHLLGVCVWVGGQLVLGALVPVLRTISPEAPGLAARRFSAIAWPFFVLIVATGIWNLASIDAGSKSAGYNAVLGIKLLLVAASGIAAFVHSSTENKAVRGATGGGAAVAALGAFACGVLMTT